MMIYLTSDLQTYLTSYGLTKKSGHTIYWNREHFGILTRLDISPGEQIETFKVCLQRVPFRLFHDRLVETLEKVHILAKTKPITFWLLKEKIEGPQLLDRGYVDDQAPNSHWIFNFDGILSRSTDFYTDRDQSLVKVDDGEEIPTWIIQRSLFWEKVLRSTVSNPQKFFGNLRTKTQSYQSPVIKKQCNGLSRPELTPKLMVFFELYDLGFVRLVIDTLIEYLTKQEKCFESYLTYFQELQEKE